MAQPPAIGSPLWVLHRLLAKLEAERPQLQLFDDYYWGEHPLPHVPADLHKRYLVQFQELLRQSKANFMQLVIDAMANRCRVQGFRLSASEDDQADKATSAIWHANEMATEHRLAIRDTFVKGRGALSVWYGDEHPVIAVEDARQTIVELEPGSRRRRAALKVWVDDWTGQERANVYLPDGIYKFRRKLPEPTPANQIVLPALMPAQQVNDSDEWEELTAEFVKNPVGVVPIVPLVARPDGLRRGHSEIEGVIPIQERINGGLFNRALAGWFTAFRQKWATGVDIPEDENGNAVEPWQQAIDRMFVAESTDAKFGSFDATDIIQYLKGHETDIKDIAAITFTPRHFLIQSGQEPSGDAINSADAPLVAKVYDREDYLAEGLRETLRLVRLFSPEDSAVPPDSEIVWADPRDPAVIEAARTDAVLKQLAGEVISRAMAQEKLGYTPEEIKRMADDITAEALQKQGVALAALVNGTQAGDGTGPDGNTPAG